MTTRDIIADIDAILRGDISGPEQVRGVLEKALPHLWLPIEIAPKDGTTIMVWADGYEWPEVVRYEFYDPADAEEFGENGYWRFAEDLLTEVTDGCGEKDWTHWMPLPPAPTTEDPTHG